MRREVHIQKVGCRWLEQALPDLHFNRDCDPANVPAGTWCYTYPEGRERELEAAANELGLSFAWGIIPQNVIASAIGGSTLYLLMRPLNTLTTVNISNPAAMVQGPGVDLTTFPVQQVFPNAIATNAAGKAYVQNADDGAVPIAPSWFVVYNVTAGGVVTQQGSINLGVPTAARAFEGNSLVCKQSIVWSLLGGDGTANPATLRKIDVSNPLAPVVSITVQIGTFLDQPRRILLDNGLIYILSGTPGKANQRIFVVDAATLLPVTILEITDAAALTGVHNFFIRDGLIHIIAGTGIGGSQTNYLIVTTGGRALSSQRVAAGPSGLAVAGAPS